MDLGIAQMFRHNLTVSFRSNFLLSLSKLDESYNAAAVNIFVQPKALAGAHLGLRIATSNRPVSEQTAI